MSSYALYFAAAFFEIVGCYCFWMWQRLQYESWIAGIGVISLILFAYILTFIEMSSAGRAFVVYGTIYIASSFIWMRFIEKIQLTTWDIAGLLFFMIGGSIILVGNQIGT